MAAQITQWTLVWHISGQHRYFRPTNSTDLSIIAVADMSQRIRNRPDSTDDGLLYLDRTRPVNLFSTGSTIPLCRPMLDDSPAKKQRATSTPGTLAEGIYVVTAFGLKYTVDGQLALAFDLFTKHADERS